MKGRIRIIGAFLALAGLGFLAAGAVAYVRVQNGYGSLQAFSEAQNVTLSYNEEGQLVDRGTTEGAQNILTLLREDWGYPVNEADLNPNDPLVNTATEYMYQMATIGYHTLQGTQTVVLAADEEYNGEVFPAGTYEFEVDGRYWTDFDRMHPIEGPARSQAWSGTVHGLFGELGVGTVTASALQMGLAISAILAALGGVLILAGAGVIWASRARRDAELTPGSATVALEEEEPVLAMAGAGT